MLVLGNTFQGFFRNSHVHTNSSLGKVFPLKKVLIKMLLFSIYLEKERQFFLKKVKIVHNREVKF